MRDKRGKDKKIRRAWASNKKGKKKGQGAMECLMTYWWAILIVIIIAGALYLLVGNQCSGGSKIPHDCYVVNDGGGNETCSKLCNGTYYVAEKYCVSCPDCFMCFYGCDLIDSNEIQGDS